MPNAECRASTRTALPLPRKGNCESVVVRVRRLWQLSFGVTLNEGEGRASAIVSIRKEMQEARGHMSTAHLSPIAASAVIARLEKVTNASERIAGFESEPGEKAARGEERPRV